MSIETLVETAKRALTAPGFVTESGWCKQWVREVVQAAYGNQYDNLVDGQKDANALGRRIQAAGYDVTGRPLAGDIVVKFYTQFGHTGICIGTEIAENSSYWWNRHPGDARGARTLAQWGTPSVIGRLPEAATHWSLDIGTLAAALTLATGKNINYAPVGPWCEKVAELLGVEAVKGWDGHIASVNGVPLKTILVGNKAYSPVRELASATGLQIDFDMAKRTVAVW